MSYDSSQWRIGAFLALQFAFQPFLTKWYVSPSVISSSVVLMCEISKILSCLFGMAIVGTSQPFSSWSFTDSLMAAGPPAMSYTAQNLLVQTAYQNLDGMTFNVINQTKILFNALFVFLIIGDRQTPVQILALAMIFAASVLVSLGDAKSSQADALGHEDFWLGAACCAGGSALSGLGSAITELVLTKKKRDTLVFSAELSFLSSISILANLLLNLNGDGGRALEKGLFHSWTSVTWAPVIANSLGGVAVGAVTKYFGSVRKGFAIVVGLVLSAVLRTVVSGRSITPAIAVAVPLASSGILLHLWQKRLPAANAQKHDHSAAGKEA